MFTQMAFLLATSGVDLDNPSACTAKLCENFNAHDVRKHAGTDALWHALIGRAWVAQGELTIARLRRTRSLAELKGIPAHG